MGVHEHKAQTKTDRLIEAVESLCAKLDETGAMLGRVAAVEAEIDALNAKIEMVHERARTAAFLG